MPAPPSALLRHLPVRLAATLLALGLLGLALAFHVPMMLWDHLDLVPMLEALQQGRLPAELWQLHGGHLHSAAYAVLLTTTWLSGGVIWLDSLASWVLLLGFAALVSAMAHSSGLDSRQRPLGWLLLVFIALFPGHLANLQWGWQVAVFLCLLGVALTVFILCRSTLSVAMQALALAAAVLALLSFATAVAVLPTAVLLICLRNDLSARRRIMALLPWVVLCLLLAWQYQGQASRHGASLSAGVPSMALYVLNFLGGGLLRFAEDLAPLAAATALAGCAWLGWRHRGSAAARPWIGFAAFGVLAACAVAVGRSGPFGADHAFVTRYVSFSSLFWLGFCGLLLQARMPTWGRLPDRILLAIAVLLAANGLHMIRQSAQLGAATRETAEQIRQQFPAVDNDVLADIYFEQPETALQRLHTLRQLDYPPFRIEVERDAGASAAD